MSGEWVSARDLAKEVPKEVLDALLELQGRVGLTSCEDNNAIRFFDRKGEEVTPTNERRYVQELTVVKVTDRWKVSTTNSTRVHSFKGQPCAA